MDFRGRIRQEAAARGIQCAVHFTQLTNLPGIVANGLLSRVELIADRSDGVVSATNRLDGEISAVSVSVSAMNWAMFQSKRSANSGAAWVVLFLDPSIFWTKPCRFLSLNAAKSSMRNHRGRLDGPWAFSEMFSNEARPTGFEGPDYRKATQIPDYLTTRPEAEVQVFSQIPPSAILEAWVETEDIGRQVDDELAKIGDGRDRTVNVGPFAPRFSNDFSHWG
jgi:hypothetical protein